jgi:ribosome maturation factor RimP
MHIFRGFLAITIAASLAFGQSLSPRAAERGEKIREKVERLGPGADVRVQDRQGNTLRGTVESFDDSGFHLKTKDEDKVFRYYDVNLLELAKRNYSAQESPDPAAARRVALEMGLGRKVDVKTTAGEKYTGKILRVDAEELAIELTHVGSVSIAIPYSRMQGLKVSHLPLAAKIGIGVGVGFGVFACAVLAVIAAYDD